MNDQRALEGLVGPALQKLAAGQWPSFVLGALAIDAYELGSGRHPLATEPYPGFIIEAVVLLRAMVRENSAALAEFPEIKGIVDQLGP